MSSARQISVGGVTVGAGRRSCVQSMTCTPTGDAEATLAQVRALAAAGCELVRVSLPTTEEVAAFARVVREAPVPIIADIHFEWRLALAALECGAAGVRVNPGTLRREARARGGARGGRAGRVRRRRRKAEDRRSGSA